MKNFIRLLPLILFSSCFKEDNVKLNSHESYIITGTIIDENSKKPIPGLSLAVTQHGINYSTQDPFSITDSSGYFQIEYKLTTATDYVNVYPKCDNYECVYGDISILKNLPSGKDLNLGKIYIDNL